MDDLCREGRVLGGALVLLALSVYSTKIGLSQSADNPILTNSLAVLRGTAISLPIITKKT